jgi:hypothetical protein
MLCNIEIVRADNIQGHMAGNHLVLAQFPSHKNIQQNLFENFQNWDHKNYKNFAPK